MKSITFEQLRTLTELVGSDDTRQYERVMVHTFSGVITCSGTNIDTMIAPDGTVQYDRVRP